MLATSCGEEVILRVLTEREEAAGQEVGREREFEMDREVETNEDVEGVDRKAEKKLKPKKHRL
jgi:hypothetical protein